MEDTMTGNHTIRSPEPLNLIIDTIVREVQPEQVILFGSRAQGTASTESDYDLLVIVRDVQNERLISRRIYRALLESKIVAAVDVVVANTETIKRHESNPFYIYRQALQEGKIFYDQQAG
jgi:predicted nucleotidyltransferase